MAVLHQDACPSLVNEALHLQALSLFSHELRKRTCFLVHLAVTVRPVSIRPLLQLSLAALALQRLLLIPASAHIQAALMHSHRSLLPISVILGARRRAIARLIRILKHIFYRVLPIFLSLFLNELLQRLRINQKRKEINKLIHLMNIHGGNELQQ